MATITRSKTWVSNETLTASDLNAEFDNVISGANSFDQANLSKTDDYTMASLIVGTGITSTDGDSVHIHPSSAGDVTADTTGDELVIEKANDVGMSFLCPNNASASIFFGDADTNNKGSIIYDHGTDMAFTVEATEVLSLSATVATLSSQLTVGVNDTGHDVKFFGATSGAYWLWDESADGVVQIGTLTVGVDDAGHDVKFFGDAASAFMLWDTSTDDLVLGGAAQLYLYDAAGGEHISSDGTDLTINSGRNINLTCASGDVVIPANIGLTFGSGEKIEGDNTDLTVTSGGLITLTATGNTVVTNNALVSGTSTLTGLTTHGGNVISDTDSTDDLGTTSVRWANVYTDNIGDTGQDLTVLATTVNLPSGHVFDYNSADVTLTHSSNTLTVAGGTLATAALTTSPITASGIIKPDNATDATSGTDGSLQTDGGLSVVKDIWCAATIHASGDTATGDNATMGYTSAEGLILTGQGSTSDVTIKNDADATIISIPTGTTQAGIGTTTANSNMTTGLTINQGATDNHILTLKSSDIDHDITTPSWETDDFCIFSKHAAHGGGVRITGISDGGDADPKVDRTGIALQAISGTTADTTKSTSGLGILHVKTLIKNGTDAGAPAANSNLMTVANYTATQWLVDADGDPWQKGGAFISGDIDMVTTGNRIDFNTANTTSMRAANTGTLDFEILGSDIVEINADGAEVVGGIHCTGAAGVKGDLAGGASVAAEATGGADTFIVGIPSGGVGYTAIEIDLIGSYDAATSRGFYKKFHAYFGNHTSSGYDLTTQETVSMGDSLKSNLTMALAHSGAGYIYNLTFTNAYSVAFAGTISVKWISTRGEADHTITNNQ